MRAGTIVTWLQQQHCHRQVISLFAEQRSHTHSLLRKTKGVIAASSPGVSTWTAFNLARVHCPREKREKKNTGTAPPLCQAGTGAIILSDKWDFKSSPLERTAKNWQIATMPGFVRIIRHKRGNEKVSERGDCERFSRLLCTRLQMCDEMKYPV